MSFTAYHIWFNFHLVCLVCLIVEKNAIIIRIVAFIIMQLELLAKTFGSLGTGDLTAERGPKTACAQGCDFSGGRGERGEKSFCKVQVAKASSDFKPSCSWNNFEVMKLFSGNSWVTEHNPNPHIFPIKSGIKGCLLSVPFYHIVILILLLVSQHLLITMWTQLCLTSSLTFKTIVLQWVQTHPNRAFIKTKQKNINKIQLR